MSPPHLPRPGECQLPQPALVAAGNQTFHFRHLLGGLPLLGVRGTLPFGQLLLHLLSRGGCCGLEGLLDVGNLEGDTEFVCSFCKHQKPTETHSRSNGGHLRKKPESSARKCEITFNQMRRNKLELLMGDMWK